MTTEVIVPDLGESVLEATVGQWQIEMGNPVEIGDILVNLETDKVDVDVGAQTAGVLVSIEKETGQNVKVGDLLGTIDEDSQAFGKADQAEDQGTKAEQEPTASLDQETEAPEVKNKERKSTKIKDITPVAKRFAEEHQVDLSQVSEHFGDGRITKQDLEIYLEQQQAEKSEEKKESQDKEAAAAEAEIESLRPEERQKMSRRRQTIAHRLLEAQQTSASLTTFNDINLKAVVDLRQSRQNAFVERHGFKLGFTSFFVKAAVATLKAFPRLNAEIEDDEIILKHYYDIGIAVGAEKGLVVPVIRDADRMSLAQIEQAIRTLVQKARENSLSLEDIRGGTFTVTNGGVFGSLFSTPILNTPQVGILGLHRIEDRPVALDGEVVIQPMMYVALSYDHRIVDGREAVQFLGRIKELIEDPEMLLLEG